MYKYFGNMRYLCSMNSSHRLFFTFVISLLPLFIRAQFVEAPKHEYRAVWLTTIKGLDWPHEEVHGDSLQQREDLCRMLDSLQAIHINTILLQTRVRGDVIYPSEIEPFAPVFTGRHGAGPDYDPLAFAIEECHKRGMQLHAWLVTIPLGDAAYVKGHGKNALPRKKPTQCTKFKGAWYMEPSHPATIRHLEALVEEMVTRYDIDGIHLDYIRYPEYCDSYPDWAYYNKDRRGMSRAGWRRDNITRLMKALYSKVKSLKPWVCVSAATLGKHDDVTRYSSYGWNAYHTVHQEAQEWMRRGIVDAVFPMIYYTDNHFYPFVCDWGEHAYGRHVVAGIGTYQLHEEEKDWDLEEVVRQLHIVRSHPHVAGAAQFRSLFVTDNVKGVYDLLKAQYPYPALVPPMPWLEATPPATPQGLQGEQGKYTLTLTWHPEEAVTYNIYSSTTYPVDTTDPKNLCRAYSRDTTYTVAMPSLSRPRHYAVTAIDRYGNESQAAQWKSAIVPIKPKLANP